MCSQCLFRIDIDAQCRVLNEMCAARVPWNLMTCHLIPAFLRRWIPCCALV